MFYVGGWMKAMPSFVISNKSAIDAAIQIVVVLPREAKLEKDSLKSFAKFRIKYAIDDGVERRVRVTKPWEYFERRVVDARFTEGRDDVCNKEWHPGNCWKMRNWKIPSTLSLFLRKQLKKKLKTFSSFKSMFNEAYLSFRSCRKSPLRFEIFILRTLSSVKLRLKAA